MAAHSSVLAWRIPGTGEPGGLPSMGLQSRTQLKQLSVAITALTDEYLQANLKIQVLIFWAKVAAELIFHFK